MKAILLLSLLGLQDPDPAKVDEWVKQLTHEEITVREAATRKLVELGEKVLPLLEKHEKGAAGELKASLARIRRTLTPFRLDSIFTLAEGALKEGSKLEEWRPVLKQEIDRFMSILGDAVPARRKDRIDKTVKDAFDERWKAVRAAAEEYEEMVVLLDKATGKKLDREVLLICRSCEIEDLNGAVVICLGDIKSRETGDAVIFAKGGLEATREIDPSIIFAGGRVKCDGEIEDSVILALGGVEGRELNRISFLNGTKRKSDRIREVVEVERKELPSPPK